LLLSKSGIVTVTSTVEGMNMWPTRRRNENFHETPFSSACKTLQYKRDYYNNALLYSNNGLCPQRFLYLAISKENKPENFSFQNT